MRLNDLDNFERTISNKVWKGICMGLDEDGNPKKSNTSFSKYKKLVGIVDELGDGKCERLLTQREAILILIRARIKKVCQTLEIKKPVGKALTLTTLERISNQYLANKEGIELIEKLNLFNEGLVTGLQGCEVINLSLGKPQSERTIRRMFEKSGVVYRRNRKYQIQTLYRVYYMNSKKKRAYSA